MGKMGVSPLPSPASVASSIFLHHHPALGGGVHAVVDGGKGHLRAGPGMHGVQVVNQRLHGLIGGPVGLLHGLFAGRSPACGRTGPRPAKICQKLRRLQRLPVLRLLRQGGRSAPVACIRSMKLRGGCPRRPPGRTAAPGPGPGWHGRRCGKVFCTPGAMP